MVKAGNSKDYLKYEVSVGGMFNPSIIDKTWLSVNNLIGEEELESIKNGYFTPNRSTFQTMFYSFDCTKDGLYISVKDLAAANIANNFIKGILALLNQTKVSDVDLSVSSHFVMDDKKDELDNFFRSLANEKISKVLGLSDLEDFIFWNGNVLTHIGRCISGSHHLYVKLSSRAFNNTVIKRDENPELISAQRIISFFDAAPEFIKYSEGQIDDIKKMV